MGPSNLKKITRIYFSSSNPNRLLRCNNAIFSGFCSQSLKPTYDFPRFTLFGRSCSSSAQLWKTQSLLISFRVNARLLCSETGRSLEESCDRCETNFESVSDVEKMYKTIMDNSHDYSDFGGALENVGVGLTTDLVSKILYRLRYEEKLAFRFFNWAGHQENYAHEPHIYSEMIDILSSTTYRCKQFRIMCEILHYLKRHKGNAVPVDVLLTILKKYSEKYLSRIQKFAKVKWVRVKIHPETYAFNLLLESLCNCSLVEDAEEMFNRLRKIVKPNPTTFNVLLLGWCRVRKPTRAMKLLNDMIETGFRPDSHAYIAAIKTFCTARMIDKAVELFEYMRTKGSAQSSPTAYAYARIIVTLIRNGRIDEGYKYLGFMVASGCIPDVSTYKMLIEGMCSAGEIDMAYKFLEAMGKKGYRPDIVTYNCFLQVLCDNKQSEEALRLFGVMVETGCVPSVQTYNMLISMLFAMGDPKGATETWDKMFKSRCPQDVNVYCTMIEGLFGCGKVEDACDLLEEVMSKHMKLPYSKFDTLLAELSRTGNLQGIHRLSEHMRKFNCLPKRHAHYEKQRRVGSRGRR